MEPKTKTLLFILVSFVLGAAAGIALKETIFPHRPASRSESQWRKTFYDRLKIDSVQTSRVDSILDAQRGRLNAYRESMMALRDTTRLEIRRLLSVDQNKLYDDYIKEMNERESRDRQSGRR
jgi:hypothetical protein